MSRRKSVFPAGIALIALTAGCASAPAVLHIGDAPDIGATLSLVDSASPPRNLEITLSQPAHVAVLLVVPGRGATLVYPRDTSLGPTHFLGGRHRVAAWYPGRAVTASVDSTPRHAQDTLFDVRRPLPIDTVGRRRTRTGFGDQVEDPRERQRNLTPSYLLLVATPAPLHPDVIRRRVEGVTIPLNESEALNAIGKLVRSTADPAARWAGHAIPVRF
jgi:hypothetical protein